MNAVPSVPLNNGTTIPQLGYGTSQVQPSETVERFGRSEVFLTSKLDNGFHRPDDARRAFDDTLRKLRTDTIDLFLVHWPLPTLYDGDYVSTWRTLGGLVADGRARSVGVSNFQVPHLERLAAETDLVPAVNQVEVHPCFTNEEVRAYGRQHGIVTQAWSPLAKGTVLDDPVVVRVAGQTGKTPAQVVLRWHLQRGDVVFPKSTTPSRIAENFDVFDHVP